MIFQHTWHLVIEGRKTRTSRLVKPGERWWAGAVWHSGRLKWIIGKSYAVQAGRNKAGLWMNHLRETATFEQLAVRYGDHIPADWRAVRVRITDIHRQDVRHISVEEARAEGFSTPEAFLRVWAAMHDPAGRDRWLAAASREAAHAALKDRPAERYDAWVLTFELVV